MPRFRVIRSDADVASIRALGDICDSRHAAEQAILRGGEVLREIQSLARDHHSWRSVQDALTYVNPSARDLLRLRIEAIHAFHHAPHHVTGFLPSPNLRKAPARPVKSLCLISGFEGEEIPGLVAFDRVVVDVEHMEEALGPATVEEIFRIREAIGEHVYISTNVSETPQLVRDVRTGKIDSRSTSSLTASKVLAATAAGADVVKVGFAHLDSYKRDLRSDEVVRQMRDVRKLVDRGSRAIVMGNSSKKRAQFPLISVFFPEIGIDSNGERPREIADKALRLTEAGGWQGVLIDTFEKFTGRRYSDFYSLADTRELSGGAHARGLEFWIAGSIQKSEIQDLVHAGADLICFGGAARHESGARANRVGRTKEVRIQRRLVEGLVSAFELADPVRRVRPNDR